jgi:hypothetical protein
MHVVTKEMHTNEKPYGTSFELPLLFCFIMAVICKRTKNASD